jgi:hypothetical protein
MSESGHSDTPRVDAMRASFEPGWTDTVRYESMRLLAADLERSLADASRALSDTRNWIPVTERLPEVGQQVLLWASVQRIGVTDEMEDYTYTEHEVHMGECRDGSDGPFIDDYMDDPDGGFSHWMPLPEAPK